MEKSNTNTAVKLAMVAMLMFGFGYALVPIYNVLCDITGLNGKTGVIATEKAIESGVDASRLVTVEFDTNVNSQLEWTFTANARKVEVHPGEIGEATFNVTNLTDRTIYGQAIPSVSPTKGSIYFNKTECFCFSQQELGPGESQDMSVRFVIDPAMPENIDVLTLSYTFFAAPAVSSKSLISPSGT